MMKKIITLCFFAFALLFNIQETNAQNSIVEINAVASEKAKEMRKNIKINKLQLEDIYQAYKEFQTNYVKISDDLETNQEQLSKLNNKLDEKLKDILTPEQFEKYLEIYRTH